MIEGCEDQEDEEFQYMKKKIYVIVY